jgi:hypothetical protein
MGTVCEALVSSVFAAVNAERHLRGFELIPDLTVRMRDEEEELSTREED